MRSEPRVARRANSAVGLVSANRTLTSVGICFSLKKVLLTTKSSKEKKTPKSRKQTSEAKLWNREKYRYHKRGNNNGRSDE